MAGVPRASVPPAIDDTLAESQISDQKTKLAPALHGNAELQKRPYSQRSCKQSQWERLSEQRRKEQPQAARHGGAREQSATGRQRRHAKSHSTSKKKGRPDFGEPAEIL